MRKKYNLCISMYLFSKLPWHLPNLLPYFFHIIFNYQIRPSFGQLSLKVRNMNTQERANSTMGCSCKGDPAYLCDRPSRAAKRYRYNLVQLFVESQMEPTDSEYER